MPGFDGTGPRGMGPMTGGGRGLCSPWGVGRTAYGRGLGRGVGYGAGYGGRGLGGWRADAGAWGAYAGGPYMAEPVSPAGLDDLRAQIRGLQEQLGEMERRIGDLKD